MFDKYRQDIFFCEFDSLRKRKAWVRIEGA